MWFRQRVGDVGRACCRCRSGRLGRELPGAGRGVGHRARWNVQNGTFATIIPGVQNGKYDVGQDNFGVTAAPEKVVDFATY
jgi:ABC-type amino acid transport substrate-binding protein